jgi:DNA-binding CsgD family transcriptional regulator
VERALVITKSTAKGHVRNIYAKLGVHSREDLAALVGFEPRE